MTNEQEDALYDFLDSTKEPFTLKDAAFACKSVDSARMGHLKGEIADIFISRRIVFPVNNTKWLSRYGYFYDSKFIISPSRLELVNGILIAGHRCVPFANPFVMPHDYHFFWKDKEIESTTTEGAPEEFYPFFSIFGEEYAPQYIARDNSENEMAFNQIPGEDPNEVSIKTLDMRKVYRESFFEPGDMFLVTIRDWKNAAFDLQRIKKDFYPQAKLEQWQKNAEAAFFRSFESVGPTLTTEVQIAWSYYFGGEEIKSLPAYSLETLLFEKTDKICITAFGLESRFWFAGKEIPDYNQIEGLRTQTDETPIERMLISHNIPISEYVIQAYVKDALFRNDTNIKSIAERIAPPSYNLNLWNQDFLSAYIVNEINDTAHRYSIFKDQKTGPVRQQAAELHTAVITLAARLSKGEIDRSLLPKHTFIVLSQIQVYCAGILEDIDIESIPTEVELNAIENSMENMIDIFEELRELIDKSREHFRRNNIFLVKDDTDKKKSVRTIQLSIGGTDIWRRINIPVKIKLSELKKIILVAFKWSGLLGYRWFFEYSKDPSFKNDNLNLLESKTISALVSLCINEFTFEYGRHWTVKIIIQPCTDTNVDKIICAAGEGASPPETIEGPLRLRRFVNALSCDNVNEKAIAEKELGADFNSQSFNIDECNKILGSI
ncbi:MAG: hypothetical protein Ta2F_05190 [Termitinemataceae bacterium]|nr:MAG: hypothetical protein Ta2F_05190 [Termitinemataceae bacterium]